MKHHFLLALCFLVACTPAQQNDFSQALNTAIEKNNAQKSKDEIQAKIQYGLKSYLNCVDEQGFTRSTLVAGQNSCVLAIEVPVNYGTLSIHTQASYLENKGGLFSTRFEAVTKDGYGDFDVKEYVQNYKGKNFVVFPFKYYVTDKNFWRAFPKKLIKAFSDMQQVDLGTVELLLNISSSSLSLPPGSGSTIVKGGKALGSVLYAVDQYLSADKNPYGIMFYATLCVSNDVCSNTAQSFVGVDDKK